MVRKQGKGMMEVLGHIGQQAICRFRHQRMRKLRCQNSHFLRKLSSESKTACSSKSPMELSKSKLKQGWDFLRINQKAARLKKKEKTRS